MTNSRELLCVSYAKLTDPEADLSKIIKDAYGPDGLGILAVSDVPGFTEARARLLPLASKLAKLPKEKLAVLEDRESGFNFGWSHGKEMLEKDKPGEAAGVRGSARASVGLFESCHHSSCSEGDGCAGRRATPSDRLVCAFP